VLSSKREGLAGRSAGYNIHMIPLAKVIGLNITAEYFIWRKIGAKRGAGIFIPFYESQMLETGEFKSLG
jgi:hypothetical protein